LHSVRGWLETEASDIEKRRVHTYLGAELSDEETVRELIRIAQASIADISIIPLQDLLFLGADTRMNHPAKSEGNWRWRVNPEQFEKIPVTLLRDYAKTYGRGG
jgi:4-alpha-glucanotransferase